jgi:hypothetical protein
MIRRAGARRGSARSEAIRKRTNVSAIAQDLLDGSPARLRIEREA